jgi:hypothetical protein
MLTPQGPYQADPRYGNGSEVNLGSNVLADHMNYVHAQEQVHHAVGEVFHTTMAIGAAVGAAQAVSQPQLYYADGTPVQHTQQAGQVVSGAVSGAAKGLVAGAVILGGLFLLYVLISFVAVVL